MSKQNFDTPRVALLGNMNNNFFAIARYLRHYDIQADLYVGPGELSHFSPAADCFDLTYQDIVHELPFGTSIQLIRTKASEIRETFANYDIRIACGTWPAYLAKAGLEIDLFIPYGSDLVDSPKLHLTYLHKLPLIAYFIKYQRKGLKSCKVVQQNRVLATQDKDKSSKGQWVNEFAINKYLPQAIRWINLVPMVYHHQYDIPIKDLEARSHWAHVFAEIRQNSDFILFNHNRIHFGGPENPNSKGTALLFEGWARFLNGTSCCSPKLLCVEYGPHVIQARKFAAELKIEDSIIWLPKMYRKDLMPLLQQSDVVCGQFLHSVMTCGTILEALVARRPILGKRNDELYVSEYNLYPMLHADSAEEIAEKLYWAIKNSVGLSEIGEVGYEWYIREARQTISMYQGLVSR